MPKGTKVNVSYHAQSGRYRKYIGSQLGRDGTPKPKCWYFGSDAQEAERDALALVAAWEDIRRQGGVCWPPENAQQAQTESCAHDDNYIEVNASDLTFGDICKLWIERLDRWAASGQRSLFTASSNRARLDRLYDALPRNTKLIDLDVDQIESAVLFFASRPPLRPQPNNANAKKRLSPKSVQTYVNQLKSILNFAYELEVWDKPRRFETIFNINYKRMLAQAEEDSPLLTGVVETFAVEELSTIWDAASPRIRLVILLGLNLGWTSSDIGSAKPCHFHLEDDPPFARRKRRKTAAESRWILWP